jgi:hypothetical protein
MAEGPLAALASYLLQISFIIYAFIDLLPVVNPIQRIVDDIFSFCYLVG